MSQTPSERPLVTVTITTRHPEHYELYNHNDGTSWVIHEGAWRAAELDHLPNRLKRRRYQLHMKQSDLARLLGVSPAMVSKMESGERTPGARLARKITRFLTGVTKADH